LGKRQKVSRSRSSVQGMYALQAKVKRGPDSEGEMGGGGTNRRSRRLSPWIQGFVEFRRKFGTDREGRQKREGNAFQSDESTRRCRQSKNQGSLSFLELLGRDCCPSGIRAWDSIKGKASEEREKYEKKFRAAGKALTCFSALTAGSRRWEEGVAKKEGNRGVV